MVRLPVARTARVLMLARTDDGVRNPVMSIQNAHTDPTKSKMVRGMPLVGRWRVRAYRVRLALAHHAQVDDLSPCTQEPARHAGLDVGCRRVRGPWW